MHPCGPVSAAKGACLLGDRQEPQIKVQRCQSSAVLMQPPPHPKNWRPTSRICSANLLGSWHFPICSADLLGALVFWDT